MAVTSEDRLSDSPFIASIWQVQAESDGSEIVSADMNWDMIVMQQNGKTNLTVWGPMTKAVSIPHTEGSEALGIRFKIGTYLYDVPTYSQLNAGMVLPEASNQSFWLNSSTWELPTYENVETFIERLVRGGLLGRDAVVEAALQGDNPDVSLRSVQRRFQRITGLTQRSIHSIERAQQAALLLGSGTPILDAVYEAGYADQQHMTKSLKHLLGQTPAQIAGIRSIE
ncbi:MAG: helix-turn-helix transcriptional regulator [Anaerolineae bacterium]|nr:helix-turn-helix transcriptional regulator [Anaerolineae bacterium]